MAENIGCHNCIGACCRPGARLPLNKGEADTLRAAGTIISDVTYPGIIRLLNSDLYPVVVDQISGHSLHPGEAVYLLETDCGHLVEGEEGDFPKCDLFGMKERPAICSKFPEGGTNCLAFRKARGVVESENVIFISEAL